MHKNRNKYKYTPLKNDESEIIMPRIENNNNKKYFFISLFMLCIIFYANNQKSSDNTAEIKINVVLKNESTNGTNSAAAATASTATVLDSSTKLKYTAKESKDRGEVSYKQSTVITASFQITEEARKSTPQSLVEQQTPKHYDNSQMDESTLFKKITATPTRMSTQEIVVKATLLPISKRTASTTGAETATTAQLSEAEYMSTVNYDEPTEIIYLQSTEELTALTSLETAEFLDTTTTKTTYPETVAFSDTKTTPLSTSSLKPEENADNKSPSKIIATKTAASNISLVTSSSSDKLSFKPTKTTSSTSLDLQTDGSNKTSLLSTTTTTSSISKDTATKLIDHPKPTAAQSSSVKNSTKTNSNKTMSVILKAMKPTKFFVDTENCHIPWVEPFTPAIKKMFKPEKYKPCSKEKRLVHKIFNAKMERYVLNINVTDAELNDTSCCYKQIVRTGHGKVPDNDYKLLPCAVFHQNFVVPEHIDAMIVECKSHKKNKTIQKDAFSFIQKRCSKTKCNDKKDDDEDLKTVPSVLLVGIDSLSSFNFRRNMPRTLKFLEENHFFELQGYNKVGDNTFPNLLPLLVGLSGPKAYKQCKPTMVGGLDGCDFLWKNFQANGYKTAYAEDLATISTFNYLKKGFLKQPTDYYLRPLTQAIEKNLKVSKKNGLAFCVGLKHYADYIYDFGVDFAERFQSKPKFGMFWTNSFSHNSYSIASSMDVRMRQYMDEMKVKGILDDAITIFFSDHGRRWGPLLNLPEGFLEERLPMFFVSLPKWFQQKYPAYVQALHINRNRLATPFDIHYTLKHILALGMPKNNSTIEPPESCATAQSIFHEINATRNCKDACIPEQFCTCDSYEVLSVKNGDVKKITNLIVDEINNFLRESNLSNLCHTLHTDVITEARLKIVPPEKSASGFETFRIGFKTKPKTAVFEATVIFDMKTQKIKVSVNDIGRHDSYEPYSKCTDNKIAKKFCICKK